MKWVSIPSGHNTGQPKSQVKIQQSLVKKIVLGSGRLSPPLRPQRQRNGFVNPARITSQFVGNTASNSCSAKAECRLRCATQHELLPNSWKLLLVIRAVLRQTVASAARPQRQRNGFALLHGRRRTASRRRRKALACRQRADRPTEAYLGRCPSIVGLRSASPSAPYGPPFCCKKPMAARPWSRGECGGTVTVRGWTVTAPPPSSSQTAAQPARGSPPQWSRTARRARPGSVRPQTPPAGAAGPAARVRVLD